MDPNIAMLYENTLLKYNAMKKQKMSNKKKKYKPNLFRCVLILTSTYVLL
jgi:hypothetical protein